MNPTDPTNAAANRDSEGNWTMTDPEFKRELREEWKRGFLDGAKLRRSSVDIALAALDSMIVDNGMPYREARDLLDRLREAGRGES